jgi:predicted dehydrogenase
MIRISYRAEEIKNKYSIAYFPSFEELLDKIDALCIVTPTVTHHELALMAIEAGKHLFIEKPLTDNPVTSMDLVKRLKEKNLVEELAM